MAGQQKARRREDKRQRKKKKVKGKETRVGERE
jgi:hypothetical protein